MVLPVTVIQKMGLNWDPAEIAKGETTPTAAEGMMVATLVALGVGELAPQADLPGESRMMEETTPPIASVTTATVVAVQGHSVGTAP